MSDEMELFSEKEQMYEYWQAAEAANNDVNSLILIGIVIAIGYFCYRAYQRRQENHYDYLSRQADRERREREKTT